MAGLTDQVDVECQCSGDGVGRYSWTPHYEWHPDVLIVWLPLSSSLVELTQVVACEST